MKAELEYPQLATERGIAVSCTIKALPQEHLVAAAARATQINPRNAPPAHLLALGAAQEITLPDEHIAVLTQKYWGMAGVRLTVGLLDNPPADLRARLLSHMNAWGAFSNVRFVESAVDPQVRIARASGQNGGYWS